MKKILTAAIVLVGIVAFSYCLDMRFYSLNYSVRVQSAEHHRRDESVDRGNI